MLRFLEIRAPNKPEARISIFFSKFRADGLGGSLRQKPEIGRFAAGGTGQQRENIEKLEDERFSEKDLKGRVIWNDRPSGKEVNPSLCLFR